MNQQQSKLRLTLYSIFSLIALVIIVDFVLPGTIITDDIINVPRQKQQYYNAAQNHHYSYKAVTNNHEFLVTEDFATSDWDGKQIEFSVSKLFKEVNWYQLADTGDKSTHSLRLISGLVLPLLAIVAIFIAYQRIKSIDIILFVMFLLLIGDLVFLIL